MKHRNPLLAWASLYHYPQLVLSRDDVIKHGVEAWRKLARSHNQKRKLLAWQRIGQWNALLTEQSA